MQQNHLKAIILTTLHSTEYDIVRSYLVGCREEVFPQGNVYDHGIFSTPEITWDILLGQIRAENIESAIEAERAISYFQPDVILSIGLAHGFKDVQICDVVAATKVYGYEYGRATGKGFQTRPEVGQSTHMLIERARAEARNTDWYRYLLSIRSESQTPKVFVAPLAAGEKEITSSSKYGHFLENYYNDTIALDTSSSGFLRATYSNSHVEALIIRGIASTVTVSDSIASRQKAAYHASAFAFTVLSKLKRNQFLRHQTFSFDPLLQLEQLAYGNTQDNRSITLHPSASVNIAESSANNPTKEAQIFLEQGNDYLRNNKYKDAIKAYNKALRFNKKDSRIFNHKGMALSYLGEYGEALKAYASAINCNKKDADAFSNKATAHYKLGDYWEAQASYQHAINLYHMLGKDADEKHVFVLHQHLASTLTGLGDTFRQLGNYKEARTHYTHALKLEPTKASAYIGRGKCFAQLERVKEALKDFKHAIDFDPSNPSSHQGQGDAYKELKEWKKALASYEQSLLLQRNNAEVYHSKGLVLLRLEEYQQALEAFKVFQELSPDNSLGYRYIVAALGMLQRYEEVLGICEEASQRFPNADWIFTYRQKALIELEKLHQRIEEQETMVFLRVVSKS
jgi:tetratricopeptide (TPR) repeat protein